jgi:SAM-dependent methyltransferase
MPRHETEWEKAGQTDPYFGVLSHPQYRASILNNDTLQNFYESGEEHVRGVLELVNTLYSFTGRESVLDFGCGVGRLLIPLAQNFSHAVGVDVSPSMIKLAKERAAHMGVTNISFYNRVTDISTKFDLAHSYLVFQHIPPAIGLRIIESIADRIKPGGIMAVHLVLMMDQSRIRHLQHAIRKRFAPWHYAVNLVRGRKWNEPLQEMNSYPLNSILYSLYQKNFEHAQLVTSACTNFGRPIFSGFLLAKRNSIVPGQFTF